MEIILEHVSVRVNGKTIIRDISFHIDGPCLYFLLGRNGSGKSTLLKTIAGLIPYTGKILINGKELREYARRKLVRLIGFIWQNPFYGFFESNVEREIRFILKNVGDSNSRFHELVEYFGLIKLLKRSPFTLSGGEAKRVELCSVLVANQQIYLMDEPEGELDFDGLDKLVKFIERESTSRLILVATHNTLLAYKLRRCIRKCIFIDNGEIAGIYSPEVLENEEFLVQIGIVPIYWWQS